MKKSMIMALCFLFLSSCAFSKLNEGLPHLQGNKIDYAIHYLGLPDAQQDIAGRKVYVWSHAQDFTTMAPVTSYTSGSVSGNGGYSNYSGSTTTYVPENNHFECTIKISTDSNDIILSTQYNGNLGGCSAFSSSMDKIIEDHSTSSVSTFTPRSNDSLQSCCAEHGGLALDKYDGRICTNSQLMCMDKSASSCSCD